MSLDTLLVFAGLVAFGLLYYISLNVERMLTEVRAIRLAIEERERQRRGW